MLKNIRLRMVLWMTLFVPVAYGLFGLAKRNYMYTISATCFAVALGELAYWTVRRFVIR